MRKAQKVATRIWKAEKLLRRQIAQNALDKLLLSNNKDDFDKNGRPPLLLRRLANPQHANTRRNRSAAGNPRDHPRTESGARLFDLRPPVQQLASAYGRKQPPLHRLPNIPGRSVPVPVRDSLPGRPPTTSAIGVRETAAAQTPVSTLAEEKVFIQDGLFRKDREIQQQIRMVAKKEKENGKETKIGFKKQ
ncbi:hypothetical protein ILUMI_25010 [Ignelater luminosus]|uniref:Uncharacterized protein n=1 Tax=Ignelater luminosus TaxID=2038154 RepID=A0A8K0CCH8_IGNLU|nr:hypothetical protein ILUMI_25010 [Ignelater luminosus]